MKVAVLGCGIMGQTHARNYAVMPGVELAGVCDEQEELGAQLAADCGTTAYTQFEEMIAAVKPDVISICLPTYLHKPYVILAAQAGIHIICEKPIAPSLEEANELIRVCEQNHVRLFIAHVVRFFPNYTDMSRRIHQGGIGKVGVAHTKRVGGHPGKAKPWYGNKAKSGGVILDLLIHDIDYLRSVLGEVQSVFAMNRTSMQMDYALVTLRFQSGAIANLEGYWGYPGPFTTAVEFAGNKGIIRFSSNEVSSVRLQKAPSELKESSPQVAVPSSPAFHDPYYYELMHFINCIVKDEAPIVTTEDAYRAMEIAFAAMESAESGKPVFFKESDGLSVKEG
ncbi:MULTISPECIES: Gfo/Idh/MocA family protein [unclassified Paenibacillus]|uniref:Gfo/Idh/MocA family protein n=1 Tax=unclassified Paenibacillus TaxID=185978 RepID=UPI00362D398F